ncbi:NACHT, LRR and PYD domains-containing protein 1 isoform X2 [Heptranchias perlo]|uniref:NACHT, LRR and PYD domains-containing protein 1 isoform X2 n=1 Tax=Heptranchias perlo TaxID=212740 RepID=UPI00355A83E7
MVANCSVEEMQASEQKAPLRDFKENSDNVENSDTGSDDEGSAVSEKSESEHGDSDSSEGELDADEINAKDGQPNDNPEHATESPHLLSPGSGYYINSSCPSCKCQTNQNFDQVTPRQISKERFYLKLDHEGSYQCTATGLVFEVTEKVDIIYSILSWYKYDTFLQDSWKLCGPLFDVKSDPALLKSIYFPHSLCLADHSPDLKFRVLHIKDKKPEIEATTDHSTTHVKWNVSSFSPVGPIFQTSSEDVQHHGVVLIYKIINDRQSLLFHVYMAANNDSVIKDIMKAEKHSKQKSVKIDKPTPCHKKLIIGKTYRLLSDPQAEIIPGEIEFIDMTPLKCKSYFEVFLEQPEDLQLTLMEIDSGETMWTSKLRECDWANHNQDEEGKQRDINKNRRRKSSNESLAEETSSKKPRWNDTTDGLTCKKNNIITEKQLMQFAEKLGNNWQVFAISCLDLQSQDIEKIKDKDELPTIQKFNMLQKWKNKEQDNATPFNLRNKLTDANIEYEAWTILEGFCNQMKMHEEPHK